MWATRIDHLAYVASMISASLPCRSPDCRRPLHRAFPPRASYLLDQLLQLRRVSAGSFSSAAVAVRKVTNLRRFLVENLGVWLLAALEHSRRRQLAIIFSSSAFPRALESLRNPLVHLAAHRLSPSSSAYGGLLAGILPLRLASRGGGTSLVLGRIGALPPVPARSDDAAAGTGPNPPAGSPLRDPGLA